MPRGIYTALILKRENFMALDHVAQQALVNRGRTTPKALEVKLEAEALGEVFGKLNHGSGDELPDYTGRSLSVGDLVIDPEGRAFMCNHSGWLLLPSKDGEWCTACSNLGYLHADNDGKHEIQRCDSCMGFESDEAAADQHVRVCLCDWITVPFESLPTDAKFRIPEKPEVYRKGNPTKGEHYENGYNMKDGAKMPFIAAATKVIPVPDDVET